MHDCPICQELCDCDGEDAFMELLDPDECCCECQDEEEEEEEDA